MDWLLLSALAYLLLAVVFLIDRYLLVSCIPDAKAYVFFTGLPAILVVFLIPVVGFVFPAWPILLLSLACGIIFGLSLYSLYRSLACFEASRIVPAVGASTPVFALILITIFSQGREVLSLGEVLAFSLLVIGTFLISREKGFSFRSLGYSLPTAFLTAWYFVLTKYVFIHLPFWSGLILIKIGLFLCAVAFFFIFNSIRRDAFQEGLKMVNRSAKAFAGNRFLATGAGLLQTYAIFLAPLSGVAIINAMQGVQYVFLLVLTVIFAHKIKEKILIEKVIATVMIVGALAFLVFVHR